jgi:hypothetical protein
VGKVTILFDDIEIHVDQIKPFADTIRIPLAFTDTGTGITHYFSERDGFMKRKVSYIPTIALQNTKLRIKLEKGASCKAVLSTVYLMKMERRLVAWSKNVFFVNGKRLIAEDGKAKHYTDALYNSGFGCNIS